MKKKSSFLTVFAAIAVSGILFSSCNQKKAEPAPEPVAPTEKTIQKEACVLTDKSFPGKTEVVIPEGVATAKENGDYVIYVGKPVTDEAANTKTTTEYKVKKEILKTTKGVAQRNQIVLDGYSAEGAQYLYGGKKHSVIVVTKAGEAKDWKTITDKNKKLVIKKPEPPKAPAVKKNK